MFSASVRCIPAALRRCSAAPGRMCSSQAEAVQFPRMHGAVRLAEEPAEGAVDVKPVQEPAFPTAGPGSVAFVDGTLYYHVKKTDDVTVSDMHKSVSRCAFACVWLVVSVTVSVSASLCVWRYGSVCMYVCMYGWMDGWMCVCLCVSLRLPFCASASL